MGKFRGIIVVDRERCKGCNLCVVACPLHILALTEKQVNKKHRVKTDPVFLMVPSRGVEPLFPP